jgi:hypothetical protein
VSCIRGRSINHPPSCLNPSVAAQIWYLYSTLLSGKTFLPSPKRPHRPWGPHTLLLNACWGSLLRVKRMGRDADHSPPSRSEVKNEWSYTSAPPAWLHGVDKDNFTFTVHASFMFVFMIQMTRQKLMLYTYYSTQWAVHIFSFPSLCFPVFHKITEHIFFQRSRLILCHLWKRYSFPNKFQELQYEINLQKKKTNIQADYFPTSLLPFTFIRQTAAVV